MCTKLPSMWLYAPLVSVLLLAGPGGCSARMSQEDIQEAMRQADECRIFCKWVEQLPPAAPGDSWTDVLHEDDVMLSDKADLFALASALELSGEPRSSKGAYSAGEYIDLDFRSGGSTILGVTLIAVDLIAHDLLIVVDRNLEVVCTKRFRTAVLELLEKRLRNARTAMNVTSQPGFQER